MSSDGNFQRDVRWIPVYNRSGEIIPPFAAMRLGHPSLRERQIVWDVYKPTSASESYQRPEQHLFNGSTAIRHVTSGSGGYGAGTMDCPAMALIENSADAGELAYEFFQSLPVPCVGFRANSWKLHYGEEAYILLNAFEDQTSFYSEDGSGRAWVTSNCKPVVISTTLYVDALNTAVTTAVLTLPLEAYQAAFAWPAADNGLGYMVPLSGLYRCQFHGDVTLNDDEPPETYPDLRLGLMVSGSAPVASNWVLAANWSALLRFNRFSGWGAWNTWNGWTDWPSWGGWAGYSNWYAGTRSLDVTVRLVRGQWVGIGAVAAASHPDVDINGVTLTLTRLGG